MFQLQTHDFSLLLCACSGQRVIVQEKNEDQMVENVVTIQVGWNLKASYLLDKLPNECIWMKLCISLKKKLKKKKNMYSLAYFVKLGEHLHTWDFMVKILI